MLLLKLLVLVVLLLLLLLQLLLHPQLLLHLELLLLLHGVLLLLLGLLELLELDGLLLLLRLHHLLHRHLAWNPYCRVSEKRMKDRPGLQLRTSLTRALESQTHNVPKRRPKAKICSLDAASIHRTL